MQNSPPNQPETTNVLPKKKSANIVPRKRFDEKIDPGKIAAIITGLLYASLGVGIYVEARYGQSPENKQAIAEKTLAERTDDEKSEQMLQQIFREAPQHSENLYRIDLKKINEALHLQNKWKNHLSWENERDAIDNYFHFFKEAHHDLEVIAIVNSNSLDYSNLIDQEDQLIIITAPKLHPEPSSLNK